MRLFFLFAGAVLAQNTSQLVKVNGTALSLAGAPFVAVGFNAFWLGLLNTPIAYPSHSQIEEAFQVAVLMNATTIRSHTLGITSGSPLSLRPQLGLLNTAAFEPIDYAYAMAQKYNIKLIVPLTDNYNYYHGNYGDFSATRNLAKPAFFTDQTVRSDFKDAIFQYLNHVNQYTGIAIKNSSSLFIIELGNELGNIRATSSTIPPKEWLADISAYVKTIDSNHVVLDPQDESLGMSDDFSITTFDCYSSHFYSKDYGRLDRGIAGSKKPFIVGEFDSGYGEDWFVALESRAGVKGSLFWSLMPHANGGSIPQGLAVVNNDGFSLHYPEDLGTLNGLAGHFRRMQGLDPPLVVQNSTNVVAIVMSVLAVVALLVGGLLVFRWRSKKKRMLAY